jgi:spoIIIJ-associated protein
LDLLLLDGYNIEIADDEDIMAIDLKVSASDSGILIGRGGEILLSIQRLLRITYAKELAEKRLVLNINDYRTEREAKIRSMAHRAATKVLQSGRRYIMRGLNSAERFVVHKTINEDNLFGNLTTFSQGEGLERALVIEYKRVG